MSKRETRKSGTARRPLVIHKFGGTSLGTAERIEAAAAILAKAAGREQVVVVVSATAGTTNLLLAAASEAQKGKTASWHETLRSLRERHVALARHFDRAAPRTGAEAVEGLITELEMVLSGISLLRELSDRSSDAV